MFAFLGKKLMAFDKNNNCCDSYCCCFWFCAPLCPKCSNRVRIRAPLNSEFGTVKQRPSCFSTKYGVYNKHDELIAQIRGPCCFNRRFSLNLK